MRKIEYKYVIVKKYLCTRIITGEERRVKSFLVVL